MAITLFDLTWRCLVELGVARTSLVTGGSTTTIIDTNGLANVDHGYFEDGVAFILKDSAGAGAAPEGEFQTITTHDGATKTLTVQSAFSVAPAAGDTYGVAPRRYPMYLIIQKINNALYLDGYIPVEDTSLTTAASQTEYTLPAGSSRDLREVLLQTNADANDNVWRPLYNWKIKYSATGSQDTLVLQKQPATGYSLLLRYATPHAELRAYDDVLNDVIHPDRIVYAAAAEALRWYKDKTRVRGLEPTLETLDMKAERARELHPLPPLPSRQSKVMTVTRTLEIED
jgi:hypothetical protein